MKDIKVNVEPMIRQAFKDWATLKMDSPGAGKQVFRFVQLIMPVGDAEMWPRTVHAIARVVDESLKGSLPRGLTEAAFMERLQAGVTVEANAYFDEAFTAYTRLSPEKVPAPAKPAPEPDPFAFLDPENIS